MVLSKVSIALVAGILTVCLVELAQASVTVYPSRGSVTVVENANMSLCGGTFTPGRSETNVALNGESFTRVAAGCELRTSGRQQLEIKSTAHRIEISCRGGVSLKQASGGVSRILFNINVVGSKKLSIGCTAYGTGSRAFKIIKNECLKAGFYRVDMNGSLFVDVQKIPSLVSTLISGRTSRFHYTVRDLGPC